MDVFDLILLPIYLAIIYFLANVIRGKNSGNRLYNRYFIKGLNYKIIGALGYAVIYLFYYGGGDSVNFFLAIKPSFKLFFFEPATFFTYVLSPTRGYPDAIFMEVVYSGVHYITVGPASLTTLKICSVINLFCCNSFIALTLVVSFISYLFVWRVFLLLTSIYPALEKNFSIAFLMIPSVIFWGSCIGKDSIMISCISVLFVCFYDLVIKKQNFITNIILLFMAAYITSLIRGFVLFTMGPSLVLMAAIYYRNSFRDRLVRFIALPVFLAVGVVGSALLIRSISSAVSTYSIESLERKAQGFRSWHTTQGGSSYDLGGDDYTMQGMIIKAPKALGITLFGPFIWQSRNPVMMMSGVESLIFLYLFMRMLLNPRIYKTYRILFKDHVLMFCIPFIIILGISIGLTSFNYGALVRYKIPLLPFFAAFIFIVNYRIMQGVKPKKKPRRRFLGDGTSETAPEYSLNPG